MFQLLFVCPKKETQTCQSLKGNSIKEHRKIMCDASQQNKNVPDAMTERELMPFIKYQTRHIKEAAK